MTDEKNEWGSSSNAWEKLGKKLMPKGIMGLLLKDKHLKEFEIAYKKAFGENTVAYGQGRYSNGVKEAMLQHLDTNAEHFPSFPRRTEILESQKGLVETFNSDTFAKDLAMVVLQPIGLAIEGSIKTLIGLAQVFSNIVPALKQSEESKMDAAMSQLCLGVCTLLLAAVAPLARLYNAATRAYASSAGLGAKSVEELGGEGFRAVKVSAGSNEGNVTQRMRTGSKDLRDGEDSAMDVDNSLGNQGAVGTDGDGDMDVEKGDELSNNQGGGGGIGSR